MAIMILPFPDKIMNIRKLAHNLWNSLSESSAWCVPHIRQQPNKYRGEVAMNEPKLSHSTDYRPGRSFCVFGWFEEDKYTMSCCPLVKRSIPMKKSHFTILYQHMSDTKRHAIVVCFQKYFNGNTDRDPNVRIIANNAPRSNPLEEAYGHINVAGKPRKSHFVVSTIYLFEEMYAIEPNQQNWPGWHLVRFEQSSIMICFLLPNQQFRNPRSKLVRLSHPPRPPRHPLGGGALCTHR